MPKRCDWAEGQFEEYLRYHDEEWGVPVHDDQKHFEFLVLESAQAGLSWATILRKREGYRKAFAGFDAEKLANEGFITLAFDFRNFGESEGEPRFYESPELKKTDVKNAVSFLETQSTINNDKIGAFGVCAGAMYTLMAASEDDRIKSVVTTASWLHDVEAVKLFYGGEEGVNEKLAAARKAKKDYAENGEVEYIPTISTVQSHSTCD